MKRLSLIVVFSYCVSFVLGLVTDPSVLVDEAVENAIQFRKSVGRLIINGQKMNIPAALINQGDMVLFFMPSEKNVTDNNIARLITIEFENGKENRERCRLKSGKVLKKYKTGKLVLARVAQKIRNGKPLFISERRDEVREILTQGEYNIPLYVHKSSWFVNFWETESNDQSTGLSVTTNNKLKAVNSILSWDKSPQEGLVVECDLFESNYTGIGQNGIGSLVVTYRNKYPELVGISLNKKPNDSNSTNKFSNNKHHLIRLSKISKNLAENGVKIRYSFVDSSNTRWNDQFDNRIECFNSQRGVYVISREKEYSLCEAFDFENASTENSEPTLEYLAFEYPHGLLNNLEYSYTLYPNGLYYDSKKAKWGYSLSYDFSYLPLKEEYKYKDGSSEKIQEDGTLKITHANLGCTIVTKDRLLVQYGENKKKTEYLFHRLTTDDSFIYPNGFVYDRKTLEWRYEKNHDKRIKYTSYITLNNRFSEIMKNNSIVLFKNAANRKYYFSRKHGSNLIKVKWTRIHENNDHTMA